MFAAPRIAQAIVALLASLVATANAEGPLPDTGAGRIARQYFTAFNSGDDEQMRAFESTHRAKSALQQRSMDERIRQYRELRDRWPALLVHDVVHSKEHDLKVLVATPDGDLFEFGFEFETQQPHGLLAIRIAGPVDAELALTSPTPLSRERIRESVEAILKALDEQYVFPEVAAKMREPIQAKLDAGEYDAFTNAAELADRLTADLQAVCNDKHLRIRRAGDALQRRAERNPADDTRENYGFRRVELLSGNIGYVKLDGFHPAPRAQETAAAAMKLVENCDALIFDLRENGGGSPEMIVFLSSYLFDKPTHLNSFYDRSASKTSESWTRAEVPGKRFASDLPVYVLTSQRTFSAAEEFTYNLQCLGRATIVGETTGGGAHPVRFCKINDHLGMTIPFARAENPITGKNWEGVGVVPQIQVSADRALDAAREDAMKRIGQRKAG